MKALVEVPISEFGQRASEDLQAKILFVAQAVGVLVKAFISDIHSNMEALQAVLADIQQHDVSEIYCLGDIIGYGPNPRECIDLVMKCQMCILGNHDQGALFDPEGFNTGAERAIFWTREQLENPRGSPADNAGLQQGDIILEVNRKKVQSASDVQQALSSVPKGEDALILVWSNGGNSFRVLHAGDGA